VYLFIFESIGTQELILIGIVALIFLGPRRLPEYAHKIGKMMAEFRGTASEFRQTWEREVNFEEEAKALKLDDIEAEAETPAVGSKPEYPEVPGTIAPPTIKQVDPSAFDSIKPKVEEPPADTLEAPDDVHEEPPPTTTEPKEDITEDPLEKHNWL
jgi:sec-independent protein translocase protein TatB